MKFISTLKIAVLSLSAVAVLSAADAPAVAATSATAAAAAAPKFTEPQLLETLGWFIGRRTGMSELGFTSDQVADIVKGIKESASGKESPYKIDEIGPQLDQFMQAKQAAYTAKTQAASKVASDAFFTKIKAEKGVVALPDGLCYQIITPGTGPAPTATDIVTVNYTGTLVDGKKFDSSLDRGKPAEFPLNGVIPGWTEGLQKIAKGGKIKLYVPSALAYGDEGHPPVIPPSATLIFEIDLLDIKAAPPASDQAAPTEAPADQSSATGGM